MSFSFNNTVNGKGNNFAQGQNVTQNIKQKFDDGVVHEATKVIESIAAEAAQVQPSFPEDKPELVAEYGTPEAMLTTASVEAEQELQAEPLPLAQFEEKKADWLTKFQAIAPSVLSVGLAGSEALLAASPASPVIAALLAAVTAGKALLQK